MDLKARFVVGGRREPELGGRRGPRACSELEKKRRSVGYREVRGR